MYASCVGNVNMQVACVLNNHASTEAQHRPRYPYNLAFDYSALEGLEKYAINNLGDAFLESNYGVHSREFEVRNMQHGMTIICQSRERGMTPCPPGMRRLGCCSGLHASGPSIRTSIGGAPPLLHPV